MSRTSSLQQLNLFDAGPAPPPAYTPDLVFIRKHLNRVLRVLFDCKSMPSPTTELGRWVTEFRSLSSELPETERAQWDAEFGDLIGRIEIQIQIQTQTQTTAA